MISPTLYAVDTAYAVISFTSVVGLPSGAEIGGERSAERAIGLCPLLKLDWIQFEQLDTFSVFRLILRRRQNRGSPREQNPGRVLHPTSYPIGQECLTVDP